MKKQSFMLIFALMLGLLILSSCATLGNSTTRFISIKNDSEIDKTMLIDTIVMVLIDNGFGIENINDTYGVINTKWKDLEMTGGDLLLSVLTSSKATTKNYNSALMLTIRIEEDGYEVFPKVARIEQSSGWFSSTSSEGTARSPEEDSNSGKLTNKVISEINELLKIDKPIIWEKEIVSFNNE